MKYVLRPLHQVSVEISSNSDSEEPKEISLFSVIGSASTVSFALIMCLKISRLPDLAPKMVCPLLYPREGAVPSGQSDPRTVRYVTGVGTKSQKLRRVTKSVRQY